MSRKFLITIVLILFLLPFVSWYYLNSGLTWRKQAQEIMNGTQPFPEMNYSNEEGVKFNTDLLDNRVSIVTFLPCNGGEEHMEVIDAIYEQFKETNKAVFILLDSCQTATPLSSTASKKNWFRIPCNDSLTYCQAFKTNWPENKAFALVDRNKVIRSYYSYGSKEEKRILLEHMALLLPRERQEKVELKRGDKQ